MTDHDSSSHGSTWGLHGMVLFGGKRGLFASHLPMFHAPHDYQVLLAVRFLNGTLEDEMRQALAGSLGLWTLMPEKFELARLAVSATKPLREFTADVFEGHFERDGTLRHAGARLIVEEVKRFVHLDATAGSATAAHYRALGAGEEQFLMKDIDARPDFDHILAVAAPQGLQDISFPVNGVAQPDDGQFRLRLPVGATLLGTIYFENGELQ